MPARLRSVVIDLHTHGTGFLPRPVAAAYRAATRGAMPADVGFGELAAAGVDAVVAKAVGDPSSPPSTSPGRLGAASSTSSSWIRRQAAAGGARLAGSVDDVLAANAEGRPAVILGVEGGDVLRGHLERVEQLHLLGVRVLGLVHYVQNGLGTVGLPWQDWVPLPLQTRQPPVRGLTPEGAEVVDALVSLGVVVDLAHADRATTLQACERVGALGAAAISSHSGARAVSDFERFHDDDELRAIAATGGLVGLWPFCYGGRGVADVEEWCRHATYLAELIGPEHLAIGTDMNGVSGLMDGYRGEHDLLPVLVEALRARAGFSEPDVGAVLGGNALRVLAQAGSTGRGPAQ